MRHCSWPSPSCPFWRIGTSSCQPPGKVALRAENRFAETLREAVEQTRQRRNWPNGARGALRHHSTTLKECFPVFIDRGASNYTLSFCQLQTVRALARHGSRHLRYGRA